MKSPVSFAGKSLLAVGVALAAIGNVTADPIPVTKNQAQVMKITGLGANAKGKQKAVIDAALERISKVQNPRVTEHAPARYARFGSRTQAGIARH